MEALKPNQRDILSSPRSAVQCSAAGAVAVLLNGLLRPTHSTTRLPESKLHYHQRHHFLPRHNTHRMFHFAHSVNPFSPTAAKKQLQRTQSNANAHATGTASVLPITCDGPLKQHQTKKNQQQQPKKKLGEKIVLVLEKIPFVKKALSWDSVWNDRTLRFPDTA